MAVAAEVETLICTYISLAPPAPLMKEKDARLQYVISQDGTVILVSGMLDHTANVRLAALQAPHFSVFRFRSKTK